jgi:hypothetical protein
LWAFAIEVTNKTRQLTPPAEVAQSTISDVIIVGSGFRTIGCLVAVGCPVVVDAKTRKQKNMSFIKDILIWNVD